ncbi:hypothetical protein M1437_03620 [Patescibacteria group bacterium]|nr:hypothetical protein [Patescibacteria group bacterium]
MKRTIEVDHPDFHVGNPSKGWSRHIRVLKAHLRREEVLRQCDAIHKEPELDPAVRDYLLGVRDHAIYSLSNATRTIRERVGYRWGVTEYVSVANPHYPAISAESKLRITWAEAKLRQLKPGSMENRIQSLLEQLHMNAANDHLIEVIGMDAKRRPVLRYRHILDGLEAETPVPGQQPSRRESVSRR